MIIWLLIFRPREFPGNYNDLLFETIRNEFFDFNNITISKLMLPKLKDLASAYLLNTNINRMIKIDNLNANKSQHHYSIVIINPVFVKGNEDFNIMERISITY